MRAWPAVAFVSWSVLGVHTGGLAVAAVAGEPSELQARIESRLREAWKESGLPGITVAVVMPDDQVFVAAAGWADVARSRAMPVTARMPAGSVGKTFVAAAILQAVDASVLDLDAPIERWLGGETWFTRLPNARHLTLRLLLSHRSGVPEPYDNQAFLRAITTDLDRAWTPPQLVAFVFDKKPRSTTGSKYFYTDANYVIAGLDARPLPGPGAERPDRRLARRQDRPVSSACRGPRQI